MLGSIMGGPRAATAWKELNDCLGAGKGFGGLLRNMFGTLIHFHDAPVWADHQCEQCLPTVWQYNR